jgi:3-methyladenine DNA glycosylase AlkD
VSAPRTPPTTGPARVGANPATWKTAAEVQCELRRQADPARVRELARFFKTGPGGYGAGDQFRGLKVPQVRALVKRADCLPRREIARLVASPWHEDRLAGLLIAVRHFRRAKEAAVRRGLYGLYRTAAKAGRINNWDLVDVTAEHIVGGWLRDRRERARTLDRLAGSRSLWERRIAVLATLHFIRCREFGDTLRLAARLLGDGHDLMHKAVGWMLREVGKRERAVLDSFLHEHAARMPRTMLRYAIEKHSAGERARWLEAGRRRAGMKNPPERGLAAG